MLPESAGSEMIFPALIVSHTPRQADPCPVNKKKLQCNLSKTAVLGKTQTGCCREMVVVERLNK